MDGTYPSALQLHSILKCFSKCHVVIGLILFVLAVLADYISYRVNTLRMCVLAEVCAFYFIIMGVVGIMGAASHRRGLIIAFAVMAVHAIAIFAPAIIISSSFDIHFYRQECWGACDWNLLSASVPRNSRCQILCGETAIDHNLRSWMTRLGTDYRVDAGLISLTILEFFLSIFTIIICCREIFGTKENRSKHESASIELRPLNSE